MATYEYRCAGHGRFTVQHPIGTAPEDEVCAACGADAPRVFSPPLLGRTPAGVARLRGLEERSTDHPDVVTHVPPKRGPAPAPVHPSWANLPRP
ncbi:MAG: FmdB family zinc ribbon protein [Actinomycetes bacterium]